MLMASRTIILALAFLAIQLASLSQATPVLIFSKNIKEDQSPVTIGTELSTEEFSHKIDKIAKADTQVIYVTENFSNLRNELNSLKGYERVNYYPFVHTPHVSLDGLNLASENIVEFASLSDALADFNNKMSEPSTTTVILTGKPQSGLKRRRRQIEDGEDEDELDNIIYYALGDQCAAKFHSVYILDQTAGVDGKNTYDLIVDQTKFDCQLNSSVLTISFKNYTEKTLLISEATLNFESGSRSWFYKSGNVKDSKGTVYGLGYMDAPYNMETPNRYSYACTSSRYVLFNTTSPNLQQLKVNFYIEMFQIQPFNTTSNSTLYHFGQVNYCQGFFSDGLWMGIVASLILVAILSFGVSILMQINTMDRFDDPKGKQLNIAIEK